LDAVRRVGRGLVFFCPPPPPPRSYFSSLFFFEGTCCTIGLYSSANTLGGIAALPIPLSLILLIPLRPMFQARLVAWRVKGFFENFFSLSSPFSFFLFLVAPFPRESSVGCGPCSASGDRWKPSCLPDHFFLLQDEPPVIAAVVAPPPFFARVKFAQAIVTLRPL